MKITDTGRLLAKNSLFYTMSLGLRVLFTALIFLYMANVLPVDDFGKMTLGNAYGKLMVIFVSFGFFQFVIRQIAERQEDAHKYLVNIIFLMFVFSFSTFAVSGVLVKILKYSYQTIIIVNLFLLYNIVGSVAQLISSFFRGVMKFEYEFYSAIVPDILMFVSIIYLVHINANLYLICFAFILSRVLYALVALYFYIKNFGFPGLKKNLNLMFAKNILRETYPFALWMAMELLYMQIGTIILSYYAPESKVGIFQGAFGVIILGQFGLGIVVTVFYPYVSKKYVQGMEEMKKSVTVANNSILIVILPLLFFIYYFSKDIMELVYRNSTEISGAWPVLSFLAIAYFFLYAPPFSHLFLAMKRQDINLKVSIFTNIVNIVASFILIPRYQEIGVCIASLIAFVFLRIIFIANYLKYKIPMFNKETLYHAILPFIVYLVLVLGIKIGFFASLAVTAILIIGNLFLYLQTIKDIEIAK
ncbi:MAG: flippase [Vulcanimicrobiota bacterium]